MLKKTEWTLESILELLTPIFPDVLCGEDDNGQFVIWTGFYKDGKPITRFSPTISISKEDLCVNQPDMISVIRAEMEKRWKDQIN